MNSYIKNHRSIPLIPPKKSPASKSEETPYDHDVAAILRQLNKTWNEELLQKLRQELQVRSPSLWNWTTLTIFLECIFSTRLRDFASIQATVLLANVLDHLTDEQAYAAAIFCPEDYDAKQSVLSLLTSRLQGSLQTGKCSTSWFATLIALTSFWRSLDYLQQSLMTSNSSSWHGWWMREPYFINDSQLCEKMVQLFLSSEHLEDSKLDWIDNTVSSSALQAANLRPEQIQLAVLSFLVQNQKYKAISEEGLNISWRASDVHQKAFVLASRLCDRDMPLTSFTHLSLVCLQLLLVTDDSVLLQSSSLALNGVISIVARATLDVKSKSGCEHSRLPRWTDARDGLHRWTLSALAEWTHHHFDLDDITPEMAQYLWNLLLQGKTCSATSTLYHALNFLLVHCRSTARKGLMMALHDAHGPSFDDPLQMIHPLHSCASDSLLKMCEELVWRLIADNSLLATQMLRNLLQDGLFTTTHDNLSKALWRSLAIPECLNSLLGAAVETAANFAEATDKKALVQVQANLLHPKLQCQLDMLSDIMTKDDSSISASILATLNTQTVETLIHLIQPKLNRGPHDARGATNSIEDNSEDNEDSMTPTANNLFRIDVSFHSTCENENPRSPIAMEATIRLAAATFLVGLTYCQDDLKMTSDAHVSDNVFPRQSMIRGKIFDAVNKFVDEQQLFLLMPGLGSNDRSMLSGSCEVTRRRLRLLVRLATPENEGCLSTMLYGIEASQSRLIASLSEDVQQYRERTRQLEESHKLLHVEFEALRNKLVDQLDAHQQGMARFQRKCTQDAKRVVEVHRMECIKAERRLGEHVARTRELQERLATTERTLATSRNAEAETNKALEKANRFVDDMRITHESLLESASVTAKELSRVTEELRSTRIMSERFARNEKKMLTHVQNQENAVVVLEESNAALRESLESIFADMVSLAQLYEAKEKEESSNREKEESTVDDLTRQLQKERMKNAQLEEKYRQTEINNIMLSSKYEQVRRLLEKERAERAGDAARFAADQRRRIGAASYMSHLNTSSTSSKSEKRSDRCRLVLRGEGKENELVSSSPKLSHGDKRGTR